ncbi:unnamed protein product [Schistosoma margrebowiei]|uniref:Uncharacterized protein n=1 Tax=Schistosoma margrebowiei TaxID=48269 RepID=A0A183M313_9TREM|nr:unnamed protein product [Schistosoma margrebowiei]
MESSRPKEKRKTKEHITPRNVNRHEKDEQELDGIRKGGPGQSGLENAGRRHMLHWEREEGSELRDFSYNRNKMHEINDLNKPRETIK